MGNRQRTQGSVNRSRGQAGSGSTFSLPVNLTAEAVQSQWKFRNEPGMHNKIEEPFAW